MNNKSYVLGFIFTEDLKRVLLIKKNRPSWMVGLLNGIGGSCEKSDGGACEAMQRECEEEAGLSCLPWTEYAELQGDGYNIFIFYSVSNDVLNYKQIEDEELGLYWVKAFSHDHIFGDYTLLPHLKNLEWLIPMALNHYLTESPDKVYHIIHQV